MRILTRRRRLAGQLAGTLLLLPAAWACAPPLGAQSPPTGSPPVGQQPIVLDSVIAVINGDVLLQSDLHSELDMAALQPLSLPQGKDLDRRAAERLINRTLILQQMRSQGMVKSVSSEAVQKDLDQLRKQLPVCQRYHCETAVGWTSFLADHNLTVAEVDARWRLRMQILDFIDARFRAGIRIPESDIADYYKTTLLAQFKAQNAKAPPLESVSARIEEVLLQQHVNLLLRDWLKSLRDQGNVVILDPSLGINSSPADEDAGGGA